MREHDIYDVLDRSDVCIGAFDVPIDQGTLTWLSGRADYECCSLEVAIGRALVEFRDNEFYRLEVERSLKLWDEAEHG